MSEKITAEECIRALYEKDRANYSGRFVEGFVHNLNGPLQNLTLLAGTLISGLELQDGMFRNSPGDIEKWSELLGKQERRLDQIREQLGIIAAYLREFMQLYEIERSSTEVDINALLTGIMKVFRCNLFFKHHVKSELRLAKNLPHIRVLGGDIVPAVFHLIQNAITALEDSPKKELIVETVMQAGEISVKITDSGVGLPQGLDADILFELFESRWQKPDGTSVYADKHLGFGLYAARQLLLPYGFSVSLETTGRGTTALIRMPLKHKRA